MGSLISREFFIVNLQAWNFSAGYERINEDRNLKLAEKDLKR